VLGRSRRQSRHRPSPSSGAGARNQEARSAVTQRLVEVGGAEFIAGFQLNRRPSFEEMRRTFDFLDPRCAIRRRSGPGTRSIGAVQLPRTSWWVRKVKVLPGRKTVIGRREPAVER